MPDCPATQQPAGTAAGCCSLFPLPYQADPTGYFARIQQASGACLLDSGRPASQRGRFDILSAWPRQQITPHAGESGRAFLQRCRTLLASLPHAAAPDDCELPFTGGLLGYLAYDFGRELERLPQCASDDLQLPEAGFGLYDWALISDHLQQRSQLVFHPHCPAEQRQHLIALFSQPAQEAAQDFCLTTPFSPAISPQHYQQAIQRIHDYILAGDCYQVNYTQRFTARWQGAPWTAWQALRQACPTPFAGYLNLGDAWILSHSPERFLHLQDGQVESRPIKGTRPRGQSAEQDAANAAELQASEKDRAENLMIVDLLRNDIGRSCRIGSVQVPELFALESYPNVHHLVSSVTGELAAGLDAFDLLAGSFPGGSITGAPKIRAMQIIDELEPSRRSIYCGSLLYIDSRGQMDSSICIRTLLLKDGQAHCWGGGGIVIDSNWQAEYEESCTKVRVLLQTLEQLSGH